MPKMIFVNLPAADLVAATHFYEALCCTHAWIKARHASTGSDECRQLLARILPLK